MMRHFRLPTLVALFVVISAVAVAAAPFAYITNSGNGSVSVIDLATNSVVQTITVGTGPFGIAFLPDGSRAYVANIPSWTVSVVDTASRAVIAVLAVDGNPTGVAVNPAGTRLYVTRSSMASVEVIDTSTHASVAIINGVGVAPRGVAVSPDGRRVYVSAGGRFGAILLAVIDAETNAVIATISGNGGAGVVVSPDGNRVYVANQFANNVSVVDTATNAVSGTYFVGTGPVGLTLHGSRLYVANSGNGALSNGIVTVMDTISATQVAEIEVGPNPQNVALSDDGSRLYVVNRNNATVSVIETVSYGTLATIPVGSTPAAFGAFIQPSLLVATTLQIAALNPGKVILGSSDPEVLRAKLTRQGTTAGVPGAAVSFTVDGAVVGSATTGSDGVASFTLNPSSLRVGLHQVQARYGGSVLNGTHYEASASGGSSLHVVYHFGGFLTSKKGSKGWKAGSKHTVRWQLTNASGLAITSPGTVESIRVGMMACGGPAPTSWTAASGSLRVSGGNGGDDDNDDDDDDDDDGDDDRGSVGKQRGGHYQFKWRTNRTWSGKCVRFVVSLNDATTHTIDVRFR